MDDEALFGRVVYRLEYGEAVARGIVAPLKLVFLDISLAYKLQVAANPDLRIAVANDTDAPRPMLYYTYGRQWFRDSTNYSELSLFS